MLKGRGRTNHDAHDCRWYGSEYRWDMSLQAMTPQMSAYLETLKLLDND